MIGDNQEMKLLKASLSIGLYLHITVDNMYTVMTQKKRKTSYMLIRGLQEMVVKVIMAIKRTEEISNLR